MSRFANFIKGVTSAFSDGDSTPSPHERRARARSRRRERFNSPDVVQKDDGVNRRAQVNNDVRDAVRGNARTKPYDPVFLRDISANAVVQAYIDTLSQDVASAAWSIKARDEDADISDEALAKVERRVRQLPPGQNSFRDLLESTTRVLLELGDATLVKHYYEDSNRLAEVVPVDSASFFKKVDNHGITEGYIQVSHQSGQKKGEYSVDDVVWVEWSSRPDRFYGQGPLEKAQNEVELLEELAEKERLDLIQGSPPGVVSPEVLDDYGGLPNDEDWETFVESMRLDEGERHRMGYSKTPVDFEPITPNYQELQILERSKYWVTVLGSVFKVNPSYAGFDFENVNRATDQSQQEAYAQRGFRVTLRQVEEALNRALVWDEFSPDIKFEFEREQTVEERKTRAELVEEQATAGKEMANAGRDVSFRDGRLIVEDGPIEEGDVGGGGGGGGLFASVDDPDEADMSVDTRKGSSVPLTYHMGGEAVDHESGDFERFLDDLVDEGGTIFDVKRARNTDGGDVVYPPNKPETHDPHAEVYGVDPGTVQALIDKYDGVHFDDIDFDAVEQGPSSKGGSGNGNSRDGGMSKGEVAELDRVLLKAYATQIMPPSVDHIEKQAWAENVPEFVIDAVREVIDRGAVFDNFDSLPGRVADTIGDVLSDALTDPQGWRLDDVVDSLSDALPRADPEDLETIARTESASVLNEAREEGYRDRGFDDAKFKWVGPSDSRTTDACEDLKDMTNPDHGGTPVSLPELIDAEREVHDEYFDNLSFRKHTIHPNERHTFVRAPGSGTDDGVDVDVPSASEFADQFEAGEANVEPIEQSAKACDHDDSYGDVIERVAKATNVTRRVAQIEDALSSRLPTILRECFEKGGSTRQGLKVLNNRLRECDDWDEDEDGMVSSATIYEWANRYDGHVDHLT